MKKHKISLSYPYKKLKGGGGVFQKTIKLKIKNITGVLRSWYLMQLVIKIGENLTSKNFVLLYRKAGANTPLPPAFCYALEVRLLTR